MSRSRYYTFIARAPFDAPYDLAYEAEYCEWDYHPGNETVTGYVQYKHPRVTPKWLHTRSVFTPSSLSYMGSTHKNASYCTGVSSLPYVPKSLSEFFQAPSLDFSQEVDHDAIASRIASKRLRRRIKAAELKEHKQNSWTEYYHRRALGDSQLNKNSVD